jgi:hypothetical protein
MAGLRYRAPPMSSREQARAVERALIDCWHPTWNAHPGGTKSAWVEATYPKVAWAWRWRKNRDPSPEWREPIHRPG